MATRLKRAGYDLVLLPPTTTRPRQYRVEGPDGTELGTVGTYQATMERKSPGKRYVNSRWQAQRWWAKKPGADFPFLGRFETAGEAAQWLLR